MKGTMWVMLWVTFRNVMLWVTFRMTLLRQARRNQRETGCERMALLLPRAPERWTVEVEASRILATRRRPRSAESWRQK